MCKKTSAKPNNYTKAIDIKDAWIYVDGIYKGASSNNKDITESIPGHIIFIYWENSAISNNSKYYKEDKG